MSAQETSLNGSSCQYCDGLSPRYQNAKAILHGAELELSLALGNKVKFALSQLSLATPYRPDKALSLRSSLAHKVRILIEDRAQVEAIMALRPDFKLVQNRGYGTGTKVNFLIAIFAAIVIIAWSFESVLPHALATIAPLS